MLWSALLLAISFFLSFASPSTPATTTSPHPAQATQCFPHLRAALGLPSASTNLGETGARSGAAASTTNGGTSTEYQVDADGFLIKKVLSDGATWKYVWDAHGQLSEVERPDGERMAFTYDAFGRRTSKTGGGKTTEYVWDGDDLVHERVRDAASGQVTAPITTWVFEPGTFTPLAKLEGRKRYGVVTDHLGSPTMLATEAGKIAWRAQTDVYGVPREEPGVAAGSGAAAGGAGAASDATANPWRFPGQYEDAETGLYYNRFRYYDPELGRYLSEDPIGVAGGVALFGYVHEPLGWVDWFGLAERPPTGLAALTDQDLSGRVQELMFRERSGAKDGTKGLVHRIREQIRGASRPGTNGWLNHEKAILSQQDALRRALKEMDRRGLAVPKNAWAIATAGAPKGNQRRLPGGCK